MRIAYDRVQRVAIVAAAVCVLAFGIDFGAGANEAFALEETSPAQEAEALTTFTEPLEGLDVLMNTVVDRDLARYLSDEAAKHAVGRAAWERVQAWRERFPEGDYSDVLFIGDSIMDEARWDIHDAMPGCEVNADSGRTLEEGGLIREDQDPDCGVLDYIRDDDGSHTRYVIGTGNNDAGGVSLYDAEEIISCLGPDKEIYFITEMVTANPGGTANTNATIDAMVEAYPNVHRIDWHGFVEGRESELLRDWCHPNAYGKPLYVGLLKAGLDVCYA